MAINRQKRLLKQGLPGSAGFELSDLTDADILEWDATTGKWIISTQTIPTQLSDLTDVNTSTPTNRNVLVADGVDWESRALVEADISDLQASVTLAGQDYLTLSDQQITAGKIAIDDLANGTDGELITWSAAAAPTTVAAGTANQVLTSNGAGAAPTFQDAAGGGKTAVTKSGDQSTTSLTPVDITGMAFTPSANTRYLVQFYFKVETNNTAGVPQVGVVFPGGTSDEFVLLQTALAATTTGLVYARGWHGADGQHEGANALSAANTEHMVFGWAIVDVGASPTGTFKIQMEMNNSAYTGTFKDGSLFTYEEV